LPTRNLKLFFPFLKEEENPSLNALLKGKKEMELSTEIVKGLGLLGDPKQFPDAAFKELTELSFSILLGVESEDSIRGYLVLFLK
jgi:hypothetical protein